MVYEYLPIRADELEVTGRSVDHILYAGGEWVRQLVKYCVSMRDMGIELVFSIGMGRIEY